jgi:hypothetical protein
MFYDILLKERVFYYHSQMSLMNTGLQLSWEGLLIRGGVFSYQCFKLLFTQVFMIYDLNTNVNSWHHNFLW